MIIRIDENKMKTDKNGRKLTRDFSRHSSSSSSSPNNTLVSGLSRRVKLSEGTMSSNVEDELTCRKFKFPKKSFCDSIPRKLRSAIGKRSCKTASSPLLDPKRLKYSINGVPSIRNKSNTSLTDGCSDDSSRLAVSLPISKEEEEVAETLFALAGMVSVNGESLEDKIPGLTRINIDDPTYSSEDPVFQKEDQGTACNQPVSSKKISLSCPKLSEGRQLNQDLKVSVPPVNIQRIPPLLRTCDGKQPINSATISQISTAPIWQRRVDDTITEKLSHPLWQSQHFVDPQAVDLVTNQGKGPFREVGLVGLPIKSSAIVFPSWVDAAASSSRPSTYCDSAPVDKVLSCVNDTIKSRKRCITHVHISHLIQGMQKSEGKDNRPLDAYQLQLSQSSNHDLSGAFTSHMFSSTAYKNIGETGNKLPMNLEHSRDKDNGLNKQSFDFLSLSTRVGPNTNANIGANCLEAKGSASLPCSTPQVYFSSKAYRNQVAVASMAMPPGLSQVQLQKPQFYANTFNHAHVSHTGTAKPSQLTQPKSQHQQYQIWTSQLATQFRPGPLFTTHIANWQAQKQDMRISHQPSSCPFDPTIGAKYLHVSQQQPQLIGRCPPLPHPSAKPQTAQLQPDGVLPFQLLCNERL